MTRKEISKSVLKRLPGYLAYLKTISGDASPYARQQLMHYIETELGIPKERQSWN